MAFPIVPKKRSGSAGNPGSLNLGELAVNTFTGELFLGADEGVILLNRSVPATGSYYEFFEHFLGISPLSGNMGISSTGGASIGPIATSAGELGILEMRTSTATQPNISTTVGHRYLYSLIGNSSARVICKVAQGTATWFDATLTGAFRFGWGSSLITESVNAIYFRSENRQQIDFVTKTSVAETVTNTGFLFSPNIFRNLEIIINAAGTQVVAKIDGAIVATHTTNIPTAVMYFNALLNRVASTPTLVSANLDFIYFNVTPNTPYFV